MVNVILLMNFSFGCPAIQCFDDKDGMIMKDGAPLDNYDNNCGDVCSDPLIVMMTIVWSFMFVFHERTEENITSTQILSSTMESYSRDTRIIYDVHIKCDGISSTFH